MNCTHSDFAQRMRSVERFETSATVMLHRHHGGDLEVTLEDVSTAGFRCKSPEPLLEGAAVTVRLPGYDQLLFATAAWSRGCSGGFSFVKGFSSRRLMSIRREASSKRKGWRRLIPEYLR